MTHLAAPQAPTSPATSGGKAITLQFNDNTLLPLLLGDHDRHLVRIEQALGVRLSCRGNRVAIAGDSTRVDVAQEMLRGLWRRLERGESVGRPEIEAAIRVAQAVAMLQAGKVDRIVLSRPAVEAGERLGFLPGDMKEKIDPYLRPLYDALHDMMPADQVIRRITNGEIAVAPLAFMRGRTLAHCYAILDEAQNTTAMQMKMFLTRMGDGTRMVITGDLSQIDLPSGVRSGLRDALDTVEGLQGIGVVRFEQRDVVRHPLVARIVGAYDQREAAQGEARRERERPPVSE